MEQESVIGGVSPGGFTDVHQVRILICYLLSKIRSPLSAEQFGYIFETSHLVNYFTLSDALARLLDENHLKLVEFGGINCYQLNPLGEKTASLLKQSLPRSVRDKVVTLAQELLDRQRKEQENEVTIEPVSNGYNIHFKIHDSDFDLMSLSLYLPDEETAKKARTKFLDNPTHFYAKMIQYFTEDQIHSQQETEQL